MTTTALLLLLAGITTTVIAFFIGDGTGYERGRFDAYREQDERDAEGKK